MKQRTLGKFALAAALVVAAAFTAQTPRANAAEGGGTCEFAEYNNGGTCYGATTRCCICDPECIKPQT